MLGRPNLVRHNCQEFRIVFHLDLSSEQSLAAMRGSHSHEDSSGKLRAFYGKTYKSNQQSHVVDGLILNVKDCHYHFNFRLQQEDRGKPPTDIKSPDILWDLAIDAAPASEVDITYYGSYRYPSGFGWNSSLPIPHEMEQPLKLPRVPAFTHIAGLRLCNFRGDNIADSIDVKMGANGEITHELRLQRQQRIDARLFKRLFREGNRISSSLLAQQEDKSNGDT